MDVLYDLETFYSGWRKEKGYIGSTVKNRLIPFVAVEKTPSPIILVQGAIHAREFVTARLIMILARRFDAFGKLGKAVFIPAVDLDGIKIAETFGDYKANANGVDLNVNFDARWSTGKSNVFMKAKQNFVGKAPFSEPESAALRDFTLKVAPDATLSYHSKGEEIYWDFHQTGNSADRDAELAELISASTGYVIKPSGASAGGYKDWCIEKLKIPAFTLEVGEDRLKHPIGKDEVFGIFLKNKNVVSDVLEYLWKKNSCQPL